VALALCLAVAIPFAHAAVMGIDYGTDWFKVGLVKPGIPLEIVLNKESQRKTETVVTIRNNVRSFGADAVNSVSRAVVGASCFFLTRP
jgi:hypoxia up-regulated 1